jgi:lipoyl synthase
MPNIEIKEDISGKNSIQLLRLGVVDYTISRRIQDILVERVIRRDLSGAILLCQHPGVITLGAASGEDQLRTSVDRLQDLDIDIVNSDRGGMATGHNPGQLVVYPIIDLRSMGLDVEQYLRLLECTVIQLLAEHHIEAKAIAGKTGVWVGDRKIASLGVRVRRGVACHGVAVNINNDLSLFDHFIMCGLPDHEPTSLEILRVADIDLQKVECRLAEILIDNLGIKDTSNSAMLKRNLPMTPQLHNPAGAGRKPEWVRMRLPGGDNYKNIKGLIHDSGLHTVCESARCPNLGECWQRRTATFMLLGNICTRACRFCAVPSGVPLELNQNEPDEIVKAAIEMNLKYVVLTSVNRDDLPDGGAEIFARTIRGLREAVPGCKVETLIPDFLGDRDALNKVLDAQPDVLNHNLETVPRLFRSIQPRCNYQLSMELLKYSKQAGLVIKSGLVIGIGEHQEEIYEALADLAEIGCDITTIGQYLRPNTKLAKVDRYVTPAQFEQLRWLGESMGIGQIFSGPMVRSSYHAEEVFDCKAQ